MLLTTDKLLVIYLKYLLILRVTCSPMTPGMFAVFTRQPVSLLRYLASSWKWREGDGNKYTEIKCTYLFICWRYIPLTFVFSQLHTITPPQS